jgi:hypothetical protein
MSTAVSVMNLESLKLELLHCLERAEEADRDRDLAVGHRIEGTDPTPHAKAVPAHMET